MHLNEAIAVVTSRVVLVPYRRVHVKKYNQWMQSAELRELTASEPLTLAQEYEMQESWREDDDKLTFIVLARANTSADLQSTEFEETDIEGLPMIGDVNMFFKPGSDGGCEIEAEIEVMIAEPGYRGRGFAYCAVSALLHYVTRHEVYTTNLAQDPRRQPVERRRVTPDMLIVRIGCTNTPSISLFQKLGFTITKEANVFGEIEMRFTMDSAAPAVRWGEAGVEVSYPITVSPEESICHSLGQRGDVKFKRSNLDPAMWCTRWFIPLFLFPVPTTRPYFLVLFLISAVFHARPCPYCIAILIGLFLTTCSWSPLPPTAFDHSTLSALNATELEVTWKMTSIAMISRCWCDFQRTPFFGYYNVTEWEVDSIKKAVEAANLASSLDVVPEADAPIEQQSPTHDRSTNRRRLWQWFGSLKEGLGAKLTGKAADSVPDHSKVLENPQDPAQISPGDKTPAQKESLPWLRSKYDLRPHGIDLIVDLGWRRSD